VALGMRTVALGMRTVIGKKFFKKNKPFLSNSHCKIFKIFYLVFSMTPKYLLYLLCMWVSEKRQIKH
jgi:hypothetical protein